MRRFIAINRQRLSTGLACLAVVILAWYFGATSQVLGALAWSTVFLAYFEVPRWWKKTKGLPPTSRDYFNRGNFALWTGATAFATAWYFGAQANALWIIATSAVASTCLHYGRGELLEEWQETERLRAEENEDSNDLNVDESEGIWLQWLKTERPDAADEEIRPFIQRRAAMRRLFG